MIGRFRDFYDSETIALQCNLLLLKASNECCLTRVTESDGSEMRAMSRGAGPAVGLPDA